MSFIFCIEKIFHVGLKTNRINFSFYKKGSTTNLMVQMKFCTIFYNEKKKMVLFNKPSRRHAELVSASPKTPLKYVQNRMMFVET
jgi:hypothetical protein